MSDGNSLKSCAAAEGIGLSAFVRVCPSMQGRMSRDALLRWLCLATSHALKSRRV